MSNDPHTEAAFTATQQRIENALSPQGVVVAALLATFPGALALYAFGSRIQGTASVSSDLDLAVLTAGYADPLRLWDIASDLAGEVGCAVDLLDLRAASTVMQHQVLLHGRSLWAVQPAAGLFECFVLSEKIALNTARAGLMGDIAKQGKIYG